jgi:hypothetical protein
MTLGGILFSLFACTNQNEINPQEESQSLFSETSNITETFDTTKVLPKKNQRFSPVVLPIEDNKSLNEEEFNSTIEWIKGKAGENIIYKTENGGAYVIINSLTNNGTICTYSSYAKKYGSSENELVSYYRFNIKDITSFEIYNAGSFDPENSFYTVKLKCVNSDYKIKWSKWFQENNKGKDIFEKCSYLNELDIYFNFAIEKKRVSKAFADLLKFSGSKKEKY